jgi:D-glycero-D-manno-heptose 1,7-bisphosphate phosphatase
MSQQPPAIFLDRDGVINLDSGYVYKTEDLKILPYAGRALKELKDLGYLLIVVTNQSGIARGLYTIEDTQQFHRTMIDRLKSEFDVQIDSFYICPHHNKGSVKEYSVNCQCRKPKPDLINSALQDWNINLKASFLVGDKESDIQLGNSFNIPSIQITGQYEASNQAAYQCKNLSEATQYIIKNRD